VVSDTSKATKSTTKKKNPSMMTLDGGMSRTELAYITIINMINSKTKREQQVFYRVAYTYTMSQAPD
jgi:hypothetical protein